MSREFLAYEWSDPALAVRMMLRLWNPPFSAGEVVKAWVSGACVLEWWMTRFGAHPDHYHRFVIKKKDGTVMFERVQYGWSGNFVNAESQDEIMKTHKQIRALL